MPDQELSDLHNELMTSMNEMLQGHDTFKEALGLDEERILALAVFARELVEQGRLDDAQTLLEGLVVLDPQNGYLHTCLGALYMQKGYDDAAMAEFHYALEQDATDVAANTYLGEIYLEDGDLESSVTYLQAAVAADPEGTDPYANRARTLAALVVTIAQEVEAKGPEAMEEIKQRAALLEDLGGETPS